MLKTVFTEKLSVKQLHKEPCVLLLGWFDGLHSGHKILVQKAKSLGYSVGIMTINGGKNERALYTRDERQTVFKNAGIDFSFELEFSDIRTLSPEQFVALLKKEFCVRSFVCGEDFRFGSGAKGEADDLTVLSSLPTIVEKTVKIDGNKIGATAIKTALERGDVQTANTFLGENFFLSGTVFKDRGIGKTLSFPTANVEYPKEKFPLQGGVYETNVLFDGKEYKAVTHYGARPTFGEMRIVTESYLDGFDGDLYGKNIEIRFVRFLRGTVKFERVEELKKQLLEDIRRVREND